MIEYLVLWILLILTHVWTALKGNRPTSQRNVSRKSQSYWRSYIQTFVVQTWMVQNTSSLS